MINLFYLVSQVLPPAYQSTNEAFHALAAAAMNTGESNRIPSHCLSMYITPLTSPCVL